MKHTLINIALFCVIVAAMLGIQVKDSSDENRVAREELSKQRQQERFEAAAREVCSENSSYRLTRKQGEILCLTKRNHRTGKVAQL